MTYHEPLQVALYGRTDRPRAPSLRARLTAFLRALASTEHLTLPERRGPRISAAERRESSQSHKRLDARLT